MSEPNVLREIQAGMDAPEMSEADYEAMEAAERVRIVDRLRAEEQALWIEHKLAVAKAEQTNRSWVEAFSKWREASNDKVGL